MQCVLFAAGRGNHEHPFPSGSTLLRGQGACTERELLALFTRCLHAVKGTEPPASAAGHDAALPVAHDALPLHS